jgi:hypothetical protein
MKNRRSEVDQHLASAGAVPQEISYRAVLDLLQRRLVNPHEAVIIPAYDRIIVVGLLNCAEFSCWFSKVAQSLDSISGIQLQIGGGGLGKRRPLGSV